MVRTLLLVAAFLITADNAHAGDFLGIWSVTRYYTPVEGQERYYNGWARNVGVCKISNLYYAPYGGKMKGDYKAEICMQSDGEPFHTADGTDVRNVTPLSIAACPLAYFGRTIHIEKIGYVRCADTGGSVKGKRIDVWAGLGNEGYERIQTSPGGSLSLHLKAL